MHRALENLRWRAWGVGLAIVGAFALVLTPSAFTGKSTTPGASATGGRPVLTLSPLTGESPIAPLHRRDGRAPLHPFPSVWWDQYDFGTGDVITSQDFEPVNAQYTAEVADDFVVPAGGMTIGG